MPGGAESMPTIQFLPPDPQVIPANPPASSNPGKSTGPAGDSPFDNVLSNAGKPSSSDNLADRPSAAFSEDTPPRRDSTPVSPPASTSTKTPDETGRSAPQTSDSSADPPANSTSNNDPQSLLASSVAAANAAQTGTSKPSTAVKNADAGGPDRPEQPVPLPGTAPAELVRTLLQDSADATAAPKASSSPSATPDTDASGTAATPSANPPPALISALNLTALLPTPPATQGADLKPSAPSSTLPAPGRPVTSSADSAATLNATLPATSPIDVSAVMSATVVAALDPQPLDEPAAAKGPRSGKENDVPAARSPNVSVTTQVAPLLPDDGGRLPNLPSPPPSGSGSANGRKAQPADAGAAASNADGSAVLDGDMPAASPADAPAVTTAVNVVTTFDPNPLVETASGKAPHLKNEINVLAAPSPNISTTTQTAPPSTGSGPGNDPSIQPAGTSAAASVIATNPSSLSTSFSGTVPADQPFSGIPASSALPANAAAGTGALASDQGTPGQPANSGSSDPGTLPPGTQTSAYPLFGSAPAALQLHAANSLATQPIGGIATNVAQVIEQTAYAIQVTHSNGQEMQFLLNPPDLGALQVSVAVHDGVLSARLEAQNSTTRQILTDNISQLKNSLTEQGVSFDRIDVQLAGSNTSSNGSGTADQFFGRQQEGRLPWDQSPLLATPETDDPVRNNSAARGPVSRVPLTSLDIMV